MNRSKASTTPRRLSTGRIHCADCNAWHDVLDDARGTVNCPRHPPSRLVTLQESDRLNALPGADDRSWIALLQAASDEIWAAAAAAAGHGDRLPVRLRIVALKIDRFLEKV